MKAHTKILFTLIVMPMTRAQLQQFFDMSANAVNKQLAWLRNEHRALRIVDWTPQPDGTRGKRAPVYAWGDPADDVPEPPRSSSRERDRAWRKRNPERVRELRKEQNQRRVKRQKLRTNALWSQLTW